MFTGKPIPFSKGSFGNISGKLKEIADRIKEAIGLGKNGWITELKKEFNNRIRFNSGVIKIAKTGADGKPLLDADGNIVYNEFNYLNPLEKLEAKLDEYTKDNFAKLEGSLPFLFSQTDPSVVTARNELLNLLGRAESAAQYKIGPFTIGELSQIGLAGSDSLYENVYDFGRHTDEISGVSNDEIRYKLQRLYGNVLIQGATVNVSSSTIVTPNLSGSIYPTTNIADTIIINNQEKLVTGKNFIAAPTGSVSINVSNSDTIVVTNSLATLNLANCLLGSTGNLKVQPGTFIKINNEIRQIFSINALGDFLTVFTPFSESVPSSPFNKEVSFTINTAANITATDITIATKDLFVCNSVCLDNVITGKGTSFASSLQANNKIFYDGREYFVVSVSDTKITVDEPLRATSNFPIYKVVDEVPYLNLAGESNTPDDILSNFSLIETLTNDRDFLRGFEVTVPKSNGIYQKVNASSPADATRSLIQDELIVRTNEILQNIINDLSNEAISTLTNAQIVNKLNYQKTLIENKKNEIKDSIKQDLAVLNALKGMIKGLIKLFTSSCSKKKRKDGGGQSPSDDYLGLILMANPERQGCDATTSDFIDILDDIDLEFGPDQPYPPKGPEIVIDNQQPPNSALDPIDRVVGPFPPQIGDPGPEFLNGNVDGTDPDISVTEDPCAKPC